MDKVQVNAVVGIIGENEDDSSPISVGANALQI